jgi:tol-pal system protein YbgF
MTTGRRLTRAIACCMLGAALGGCAMRGDVVRLERQLAEHQRAASIRDSVAWVQLSELTRMLRVVQDSQSAQLLAMTRLRADLRGELLSVQQQLVAVQELTGQSQQRLTEIREDLARRAQAAMTADTAPAMPVTAGQPSPPAAQAGESPEQLIDLSVQQLRRGSPGAARTGLHEFLRLYPDHPRAVDAWYFIGEAWTADQRADSAGAAYREVTRRYPRSPRAATSHYRLGLQALAAGRNSEARLALQRVVTDFPNSEEASLARERLRTLPNSRP